MADRFKQTEFSGPPGSGDIQIRSEGAPQEPEIRVMKLETDGAPAVKSFELPKIQRSGQGSYAATKAKYGALAATDKDRQARSQKDSRFSLNSLLREPLAVEDEERRVIEERVRDRVAAVSDDARKRASEVGYNEGFKRGYDEAYAKFQQEAAERLGHFDEFLQECETAKQEIYRANERFLIELVYRIGRMVLLRELSTDREYVARLARELIEKIGIRDNVTVHVHPDDLATAGMIREGVEKSLGQLKNLNIEPSPEIHRGGCAVETEWNAIDASVETQLKGVYEALIGAPDPASGSAAGSEGS